MLSAMPSGGARCYHVAEWARTNAVRRELREQGTQVSALHLGLADTGMAAEFYPEPARLPAS